MAQDPFGFGNLDDIFRAMQDGGIPNNGQQGFQQQVPPTHLRAQQVVTAMVAATSKAAF